MRRFEWDRRHLRYEVLIESLGLLLIGRWDLGLLGVSADQLESKTVQGNPAYGQLRIKSTSRFNALGEGRTAPTRTGLGVRISRYDRGRSRITHDGL